MLPSTNLSTPEPLTLNSAALVSPRAFRLTPDDQSCHLGMPNHACRLYVSSQVVLYERRNISGGSALVLFSETGKSLH